MSTRKTTPRKPSTKPPASAKTPKSTATRSTATPAAATQSTVSPAVQKDLLRKRELIERVVKRSGIKKKDAKPVIEAMLAEMGEALASGREMTLQPLGRMMINREKIMPDGRVIIVKVRQKDKLTATPKLPTAAE